MAEKIRFMQISEQSFMNVYGRNAEMKTEIDKLKNGINKAIEAIQDPLNNKAIIDALWMPDMQACTVVDYLLILRSQGE